MFLEYNGESNQYLGKINGKNFILTKKGKKVTKTELDELKKNKWFNYLVEVKIIVIKKDKKDSIEKQIKTGQLDINEGLDGSKS